MHGSSLLDFTWQVSSITELSERTTVDSKQQTMTSYVFVLFQKKYFISIPDESFRVHSVCSFWYTQMLNITSIPF